MKSTGGQARHQEGKNSHTVIPWITRKCLAWENIYVCDGSGLSMGWHELTLLPSYEYVGVGLGENRTKSARV